MNHSQKIKQAVNKLAQQLLSQQAVLTAAESCTGGLVAKVCTDVAGSSAWFDGGVVSYSNALKQAVLKVNKNTLDKLGAVSEQSAKEMALGVCQLTPLSKTRYAVSITGIAGPGGGSVEKPVGTVCFAWAKASTDQSPQLISVATKLFSGNRQEIREQSALFALEKLLEILK